jgi:hypothetical protein
MGTKIFDKCFKNEMEKAIQKEEEQIWNTA